MSRSSDFLPLPPSPVFDEQIRTSIHRVQKIVVDRRAALLNRTMNNSENKPDAPVQPLLDDGRKPAPQIPKLNIFEIIMSGQRPSANKYSAEMALHRPVPLKDNDETTNRYALDRLTRQSLPYPTPWRMADSDPNAIPPDFSWLANSCGGKAAIGVFGGGVMGLLMGVFLGAMSDATPPLQVIAGKDVPQAPLREQVKLTFRATADKSLYWCRNFAFITGVFGGSECLVEKFRGKHDVWNAVASGCITGAALQAKQGPQAAMIGCGGFAAFSLVIDSVMGHT